MNRSVICGMVALAMLVTIAMSSADQKAHAGLFGKKKKSCCAPAVVYCEPAPVCCEPAPTCGGKKMGFFARLKARKAARNACCAPAPTCCAPAPVCCEPAPVVCCEPAPVVCCEPAPVDCCGSTVTYSAPVSDCCGGTVISGTVISGATAAPSVMSTDEAPVDLPEAAAAADAEVPPTPET
jgi:hypothetical protein